jgi:hypothetical protein
VSGAIGTDGLGAHALRCQEAGDGSVAPSGGGAALGSKGSLGPQSSSTHWPGSVAACRSREGISVASFAHESYVNSRRCPRRHLRPMPQYASPGAPSPPARLLQHRGTTTNRGDDPTKWDTWSYSIRSWLCWAKPKRQNCVSGGGTSSDECAVNHLDSTQSNQHTMCGRKTTWKFARLAASSLVKDGGAVNEFHDREEKP